MSNGKRDTVVRIIGTPLGERTDVDGLYLADYDPAAGAGEGGMMLAPHPSDARGFASLADAVAFTRRPAGFRPDGEPNRPLTAFNLAFEPRSIPAPMPSGATFWRRIRSGPGGVKLIAPVATQAGGGW